MAIRARDLKPQSQPPGPTKPEPQNSGRQSTFYSLKDPNFAWFFASTLGQMAAVFMQMLVRGFLVFEMTGSFAALGIAALARPAPGIVLSLVGGVLADRIPKQYLIQFGPGVSALGALWGGFMLLSDQLRFAHLLI